MARQELMVVGLGAVYNEHLGAPLALIGDPRRHVLIDREQKRFDGIQNGIRVISDVNFPPFSLNTFSDRQVVAIIATPDHLTSLISLKDLGIQKFIIEKPLVNNSQEVDVFRNILMVNPHLKVYALEMCITKLLPLYLLTGQINPDDPRWQWVEDQSGRILPRNFFNSFESRIGELQAIEGTLSEGGDYGTADLVERSWLEKDKLRGGMLLDLGTHVLGPLVTAGLIDSPDSIQVDIAKRYVLGENRRSFVEAKANQPEIYVHALLGIKYQGRDIPLTMTLGKTYFSGGMWGLKISGSNGEISMGFLPPQKVNIASYNRNNIQLGLKNENGVYPLSLTEAEMCFRGLKGFDGNQKALLDSIIIIDKIKAASNKA